MTGVRLSIGCACACAASDPDLFVERRVADMQADEEAVQLRLGQRVRAGHVDRILGRQHHEDLGQVVADAIDADAEFLHALQQGRLGARRRPIDFVGQQDMGEYRAGAKFEVAGLLVVDGHAGDVGGQQVGRALQALHV